MTAFVESALKRSAPGRAFTVGVLTALPVFAASASASAATIGAAAATKGGSVAGGVTLGALIGPILGPVVGMLGGWFGVRASLNNATSERERKYVKRVTAWIAVLIGLVALFILGGIFLVPQSLKENSVLVSWSIVGVALTYMTALMILVFRTNRTIRKIRIEEGAAGRLFPKELKEKIEVKRFEYRSRGSFLGLPFVHVCTGQGKELKPSVARGWIAVGDVAIGLVSFGGVAFGGISIGGASVGVIALGGAGLGLFTLAGLAIGILSVGGVAIGMLATGGCALAWEAAQGGVAVAREIALGGAAHAVHANDEVARAYMADSAFFSRSMKAMSNGWILNLCWLPMVLVFWQIMRMKKRTESKADDQKGVDF